MIRSGIYQIINLTDPDKFYIGSAVDLDRRKRQHWFDLRWNKHDNGHLQNSWNKYGEENFIFVPLISCSIKDLVFYEQGLLDKLHPYYNIATCAEAPRRGAKVSVETKLKMSRARFGKKLSKETRQKMSKSAKGRTFSEETRLKLSKAHKVLWDKKRSVGEIVCRQ